MKAYSVRRSIALLFVNLGDRWVDGQRHAPAALPPGKRPGNIVHEDGWAQGQSGRARKVWRPPGFDPRTVQAVAVHRNDLTLPTYTYKVTLISLLFLRD
jgi:hypothetical protein